MTTTKTKRLDSYLVTPSNEIADMIQEANGSVLVSQLNNTELKRWVEYKRNNPKNNCKLLVDSGAYTTWTKGKLVDVELYIKKMNDMDDVIDYFIQVDKIPGRRGKKTTKQQLLEAQEETWNNFLHMEKVVKSPNKLLPVYHQKDHIDLLVKMLNHKRPDGTLIDYICLSRLQGLDNNKYVPIWFKKMHKVILQHNPTIKIHALGVGSIPLIFDNEWFTSVDSTTYVRSAGYGDIITPYGTISASPRKKFTKKGNLSKSHISYADNPKSRIVSDFVRELQKLKVKAHEYYDPLLEKIDVPTLSCIQEDKSQKRTLFNAIVMHLLEHKHPLLEKHLKNPRAFSKNSIENIIGRKGGKK